jgi:hypothetical protein
MQHEAGVSGWGSDVMPGPMGVARGLRRGLMQC